MIKGVEQLNSIELKFGSLNFEDSTEHINKMNFSGICMLVDTPSDGVPSGSDKPVAFSRDAVEKALQTFSDMGVNCVYSDWQSPNKALTGHDTRFKIGVVDKAELKDNGVNVAGCLWKRDFSDVCFQIKNAKESLGFSVEVIVNDMSDKGEYYLINDFSFTGVAILYKNLAAFKGTNLQAKRKEDDMNMNTEQFKEFMDAVASIGEKLDAKMVEFSEKLGKLAEKETKVDFSEVTEAIKSLKVTATEPVAVQAGVEKEVEPPAKKTEQQFVGKTPNKEMTLADELAKIEKDASLSADAKLQAKMKAWQATLSK